MLFVGKIFGRLFNYLFFFLIVGIFDQDWVANFIVDLSVYKIVFGFGLFGLDVLYFRDTGLKRNRAQKIHTGVSLVLILISVIFLINHIWPIIAAIIISCFRFSGVLLRNKNQIQAVFLEDIFPVLILFLSLGFICTRQLSFFFVVTLLVSGIALIHIIRLRPFKFSRPSLKFELQDLSFLPVMLVAALFVYLNYMNRTFLLNFSPELVIKFQTLFQLFLVVPIVLQALIPNLMLKKQSNRFDDAASFWTDKGLKATIVLGIFMMSLAEPISSFVGVTVTKKEIGFYGLCQLFLVTGYYNMVSANLSGYSKPLLFMFLLSGSISYFLMDQRYLETFYDFIVLHHLSVGLPLFVVGGFIEKERLVRHLPIFGLGAIAFLISLKIEMIVALPFLVLLLRDLARKLKKT